MSCSSHHYLFGCLFPSVEIGEIGEIEEIPSRSQLVSLRTASHSILGYCTVLTGLNDLTLCGRHQHCYSTDLYRSVMTMPKMLIATPLSMTREESDAWRIIQGNTQERLNRIHAAADVMRERLEAEGRGPSTVWEPVSSDDDEFEDDNLALMTPPVSPPWNQHGKSLTYPIMSQDQCLIFEADATFKTNHFSNMEIQQPAWNIEPLKSVRLSNLSKPQKRKVQRPTQCRILAPVSGR